MKAEEVPDFFWDWYLNDSGYVNDEIRKEFEIDLLQTKERYLGELVIALWMDAPWRDESNKSWEFILDELYAEEKYSNISREIVQHVESGRCFALYRKSVPRVYEGESWDTALLDRDTEDLIEEVQPVQRTVYERKERSRCTN